MGRKADHKVPIGLGTERQTKTAATWRHPQESKAKFSSASFLANNRVVFNISGNKYRLVVKVDDDVQVIFIRFIGSHAEYDKVDASII